MTEYTPDKWFIVEHKGSYDMFGTERIFASWSGGYLDSDSWRMSSGITDWKQEGDYYIVRNQSGSVYKLHKNSEGATAYGAAILQGYLNKHKDTLKLVENYFQKDKINEK